MKKKSDPEAVFDALTGENSGENWRHVYARQAVVEALVTEPRVQVASAHWGEQLGLTTRAKQLAVAADRLARSVSLDHRRELFTQAHSVDGSNLSPRTLAAIEKQKMAVEAACIQFWNTADTNSEKLLKNAHDFVRKELNWPWPFVVVDLAEYCAMAAWSLATGIPLATVGTPATEVAYRRGAWFEPEPPVAHAMTPNLTFTNKQDLKRELARVEREGMESVKQAALPRGRVPKAMKSKRSKKNYASADVIRHSVQWFVRRNVGGASISDLAREHHALHHGNVDCSNDRALVQRGIREAKRLLDLTQYHLGSSPLKK